MAQLRAFVRRRIANPDRADDLVGEILLRIQKNLNTLDDRERLPNWVFRIARNAIIDEYRRAARNRERLTATLQNQPTEPLPEDDEPGAVRELAACLRPLLDGLPAEQRDGGGDDRSRRDEPGRCRAASGRFAVRDEVARPARATAAGELLGQCCALTLDARGVPMDYAAATLRLRAG